MAMNIELRHVNMPFPRPAANSDLLKATLVCDTTRDIVRAYNALCDALGKPVKVFNNFSTRRFPSKRKSKRSSQKSSAGFFDLRCVKCIFLMPLATSTTWRRALRSPLANKAWQSWHITFKTRTTPLMGGVAARALLQMLDDVDKDVEEFGVADEASQILVEVDITLRAYYHMFQQGRIWQRVQCAEVPADLCVTVALDNASNDIQELLQAARDTHTLFAEDV